MDDITESELLQAKATIGIAEESGEPWAREFGSKLLWRIGALGMSMGKMRAEMAELEGELASERAARKQAMVRAELAEAITVSAEKQVEILSRDLDSLRGQIGQAERERDEVRRIHAANVAAGIGLAKEFNKAGVGYAVDGVFIRARAALSLLATEKAARERADADNAALVDHIRHMLNSLDDIDDDDPFDVREIIGGLAVEGDAFLALPHPGSALLERLRELERIMKKWHADLLSVNPDFNDPEYNALEPKP